MMGVEKIFDYLIYFLVGGISGASVYFIKIKGIEDILNTKCDAKQVEEIIEKKLKPHLDLQEQETKWVKAVMVSIANQVGAEIPQIQ